MYTCNEKFEAYKKSLKQKEEEAKNETLPEENEPAENGPKWYDKAIEDYTDTDVAEYINSRTNYGKNFSCTKKGSAILQWDCSNDEFNCLVYKMKAYSSLQHSCSHK